LLFTCWEFVSLTVFLKFLLPVYGGGLSKNHGYQAKCSLMWLKTEIQHEPKSCYTTENIDSKILVMLDKWYHFSSQCKSVLIATFKAFYVWMSFSICMQVPDGKNKFIVKEFFKSVNIKHVLEYHGWNMGSNFSILQHWILKKSYGVISFKIFSSLSREKKRKNWKSNFLYWLNNASLMNLRRWTHCSSHSKR
jgi:hypothetical protein